MKDHSDNYYWSGGAEVKKDDMTDIEINFSQAKINYNALVELPNDMKQTYGENVVVAVLDSGCNKNHKDISEGILSGYDALTETNEIKDASNKGHGTFICGLIAGHTSGNGIVGVAPKAKLLPVRVIENNSVISKNVLKGLNWLLNICPIQPDIINMSFDFSPGTDLNDFEELFRKANEKNILIVAAGQDYYNPSDSGIFYPAANPFTSAVAVLDDNILGNPDFGGIDNRINFILPRYKFYSANNSNFVLYSEDEGSSFGTAVITGVLALATSYKKKTQTDKTVMTILNEHLPVFDKTRFTNNFKIWRQ